MRPQSGFTLVEMAVVMVVMGLIMLAVFPALTAVRSANQRALTQSNLRNLMLATAGYVQANGCLPCPANPATSGANFGRMSYAATTTACGTCPVVEGIVPFVSLGIPSSAARDGWGHWITMRVDPALTSLPTNAANCAASGTCSIFAPPSAACTTIDVNNNFCTTAQLGFSDKGLCRSGLATAGRNIVTTPSGGSQQAAVVYVSHGEGGYGSFFAQPMPSANNGARLPFPVGFAACSGTGGYAQCNAKGTIQFYDAPKVVSDIDAYDDMLAYADRNTLISMLGNPGCQTVW